MRKPRHSSSLHLVLVFVLWEIMAGGFVAPAGPVRDYAGKMTVFVFVTCILSATGGLIFGYDLGISGGVTSMDSFLKTFFRDVYRKEKEKEGHQNDYCKFNSQLLTTFTSSFYIAGLIASLFASTTTRLLGRKFSVLLGGAFFLAGAAINGAAVNVAMLILGRILPGIGVGFTNQSVPLYLSEMAPPKLRGGLNMCFQLFLSIGFLVANLINYGAQRIEDWGWRVSLALAAVPAAIMTTGWLGLPDTPNSLMERGHPEKAKAMLVKIRGTNNVQGEFEDLLEASEASKQVKHPFRNILQRKYRPHLVMSIAIPFFQQLTGINVIGFYAPVLFKTIGFGGKASLFSTVMIGIVGSISTLLSILTVDRVGRRFLFIEGGIQMFISQIIIAAILGKEFGISGHGSVSKGMAVLVVIFICIYVAAFSWSWGPLSWLVPSEIFPLEIRSAGQSINVSVNLLFTFAIAQTFLAMLCYLKFGLFLFFAGWVGIMTAFVYMFLPETKGIPMEEMARVWKTHWFWAKFVEDANQDVELAKANSKP